MAAHRVKDDLGIYLHFAAVLDQLAGNRSSGGMAMHWHDLWQAAKQAGVSVQRHIVQNWGGADVSSHAIRRACACDRKVCC